MVAGGCTDVLITNQVVGDAKLRRVARLSLMALRLVPWSTAASTSLTCARRQRQTWRWRCWQRHRAYVEIDAGQGAAVLPPVAANCRSRESDRIRTRASLCRLQVYHGGIQHVRSAASDGMLF